MSGQPQNTGLGRMLASRRQTQAGAVWRAAVDGSGLALHTAALACKVYVPSGAPALQALAELGGARASHAGELPQGADVTEGDELRIPPHAYVVERAIPRDTLTWCALSRMVGVVIADPAAQAGNMSAGQYNGWTIEEGAVFASTVKWPGVTSASGYHARMDIRVAQDPDSAAILQLSDTSSGIALSSDGTHLVIAISVAATATDDLPFVSTYGYYDLEVVPPAGAAAVFKVLYGTIAYRREVTAA